LGILKGETVNLYIACYSFVSIVEYTGIDGSY